MLDALTPTVVGGALALAPAVVSVWRTHRPRPVRPMERLLALENSGDARPAPASRSKGPASCVCFGLLILTLLATPLFLDRLPGQR